MTHVRALRETLWCALLAQTTPTPSLHSPEKSSVRLVHHQNLTVHPHLPSSAHVHVYPCSVRHKFSILMNMAASTVDLSPFRHPTTPTNSKLSVLPSSCLLMCICTRKGIHVHATARQLHTSPTYDRQPINRQLSVPAYAQAHTTRRASCGCTEWPRTPDCNEESVPCVAEHTRMQRGERALRGRAHPGAARVPCMAAHTRMQRDTRALRCRVHQTGVPASCNLGFKLLNQVDQPGGPDAEFRFMEIQTPIVSNLWLQGCSQGA
jgi:hypothetical protein